MPNVCLTYFTSANNIIKCPHIYRYMYIRANHLMI